MKLLNKIICTVAIIISPFSGKAQLTEKLIVKDAGDSLCLKAFRTAFDSLGNYYFETPLNAKGNKYALKSNTLNRNPVYWGQNIAIQPYKALITDGFFSDSTHKRIYYKNRLGTKIYGPRPGKVRDVLEFGRNNVLIELCVGSKSFLYINDSLVNEADSLHQLWLCTFSDNDNVLYSVYKNGLFRLYLNYKQVDSSEEAYTDISVNNDKFYTYVKPVAGKYHIYTPTAHFGPFVAVEYSDLWNNGAYYYKGCADSECFVLVNNKLYNNIPESYYSMEDGSGNSLFKSDAQINVQPFSADNYLFTYNQKNDDGIFLNVNGVVSHFNYSTVSFLFTDPKGGYAFYGYRQDSNGVERVYKNINGKEKKLPSFSKARYKPHVMQIAPNGESLYYYETADSVYLFRDDTLLCKPASRKKFFAWDASVLPLMHLDGLEYFRGINIDGASYLVYNNTISKPLPMILPDYDRIDQPRRGSLVAGDINHNGFFIIENTAPGKYMVVINNKVYQELEGIDNIIGEQSYLGSHSLIFYGNKGKEFYQFTLQY